MWKQLGNIERILQEFKKNTDKRLNDIEKVLIIQESNLEKHMERSEHLEKIIEKMEEKDLKPLRRHVAMVEGGLKLLGLIGLLVGILSGLFKIFLMI